MSWGLALLALVMAANCHGKLLDPASPANALLQQLAPMLEAHAIDVAYNLNSARVNPKKKPRRPRLGILADVPVGHLPNSSELDFWDSAHQAGQISGIAVLIGAKEPRNDEQFLQDWFKLSAKQRVFITYTHADQQVAQKIAEQLVAMGYEVRTAAKVVESMAVQNPARFYATSAQRMVLDTNNARRLDAQALEIRLLGKQLRRKSASVFPATGKSARYYARGEPERFKKVDLGDESTLATIPEIIVSGGIAFGERASFQQQPAELVFNSDHTFTLLMAGGEVWNFPLTDPLMLKACFDFAVRSGHITSDAIIDIDEDLKIRISRAFRNTDIGYQLISIDEQPFKFAANIRAIKSVIIDTSVKISASDAQPRFDTGYEIRFINPDRRKLAETRAALVYNYNSVLDTAIYQDSWGPRAFKLDKIDVGELGERTRKAAMVAGWAALFRAVEEGPVQFSRGRYEFLKINKAGVPTPRRSIGIKGN